MDEYLLFIVDSLAMSGFLETRASLAMDIVISFLALLPILSGLSIFFAIRKYLTLHQFTQFLLFFLTLIALGLFAYIVHYQNSFDSLVKVSNLDPLVAFSILILHVVIAISTLTLWMFALIYALSDKKRRALPGVYSQSHAKAGKRVFKGIIFTALSSGGIYWVLFMA